ncbi:hypothetical protein NC653_010015 [Populus alba x Populus x berolinensis]|uniref:Uncharacterized protein n=1 Tax=Populus alba x Populus x berolinensis TaxID=444605 RepID=A0AAD6RAH1_9ROSI|nr:hypothetical protein NC653_010015 [Populus alba x Populus x berolinensis]
MAECLIIKCGPIQLPSVIDSHPKSLADCRDCASGGWRSLS